MASGKRAQKSDVPIRLVFIVFYPIRAALSRRVMRTSMAKTAVVR